MLSLLRWKNLVILAATMWVAWFAAQSFSHIPPSFLRPLELTILVLSTVCIAAGGYVINDLYDQDIDAINKPHAPLPSGNVSLRTAWWGYAILTVSGLGLAAWLCYRLGNFFPFTLPLLSSLLLWIYAAYLKKTFLTGNLLVATLSAASILILSLFEPHWRPGTSWLQNPGFSSLFVFALFAFLLTWAREILKDLEDLEGDRAMGCHTMPIRMGIVPSLRLAQALVLCNMLLMLFLIWKHSGAKLQDTFIQAVAQALVLIFHIGLLASLRRLREKAGFRRGSNLLKLTMVAGILAFLLLSLQS